MKHAWQPTYFRRGLWACDKISLVVGCDQSSKVFCFSSQRKEICAVNFGFVLSLVLVILAVVGVFIEIPLVSNYAFWFAIGAYIMLAGSRGV
jgi:hypothetical protein